MSNRLPRMCVLAATPLSIHFFLKPHLRELAGYFEVTLACNPHCDTYVPPLDLPVREVGVEIERKIAPWRDLLALFRLCRLFGRERFDIVVSVVPKAGLLGMLAAFLLRVPHRVHIFQGEVWASRRGPMCFLLKFMDGVTARLATHVLAVSEGEKRFLEREHVVPVGKLQVLGAGSICGVDTEKFRPNSVLRKQVRAELGIPEHAVVCIFLGRLAFDKGVLDLAKAFVRSAASRDDLWLMLAGPDEEEMEARLRELVPKPLSDRLRILGFTNNPEKQLAVADFLCLPSYREGFGMVILEAAAAGIPAIGTRIYGITDAIEEGRTGRLVSVGDIEELSKLMTLWCELPEERGQYAIAARSRVMSKFEQQNVVDGYVRYFRDIFSNRLS
jgi:glycosyltransferase involved in cell wall biosynthesis